MEFVFVFLGGGFPSDGEGLAGGVLQNIEDGVAAFLEFDFGEDLDTVDVAGEDLFAFDEDFQFAPALDFEGGGVGGVGQSADGLGEFSRPGGVGIGQEEDAAGRG
jgi:hypothetical protein